MATEYEGSVEQVHRAFRDKRYWLARLTESGADAYSLDWLILGEDGGIDIVTTQTMRRQPVARRRAQFHRGDLSFVREEMWTPVDGGRRGRRSRARSQARPRPSQARPSCACKSGAGSRLTVNATVQVDIPLVGGKIENFIGSQLVDLLIQEQRFTTVWITENA